MEGCVSIETQTSPSHILLFSSSIAYLCLVDVFLPFSFFVFLLFPHALFVVLCVVLFLLFLLFCLQLQQDTHLVFTPQLCSLDSCALLAPSLFVCGDSRGLVSLYSSLKKKPLAAQLLQAGQHRASSYPLLSPSSSDTLQPDSNEEKKKEAMRKMTRRDEKKDLSEGRGGEKSRRSPTGLSGGGGVSSLVALRQSDVFFTGSETGRIAMWGVTGRGGRRTGVEEEEERNGSAKKKKNRLNNDDGKKDETEEERRTERRKEINPENSVSSLHLFLPHLLRFSARLFAPGLFLSLSSFFSPPTVYRCL